MIKLRIPSFIVLILVLVSIDARSQFLMDMVDTSKDMGKNMLGLYQKYNYLRMSGYIQPQFQFIQEKGAKTYAGPDFPANSNSRFILRRGRFRFDYARFNKDDKASIHFVIQIDGTERGVFIRDLWGRVYENKFEAFGLTMGMFARPFGYEVNLSSQDRESPERGRMSQILMKTERDLGAMVSFEPRKKGHKWNWIKVDAGVFNGQGLSGPGEYDSYKDFIARAGVKPRKIGANVKVSGGLSYLNGGFAVNSPYRYTMESENGKPAYQADSSGSNIGSKAPRKYAGADVQWEFKRKKGSTIVRAEYWKGTQSSTAQTSETPGTLPSEPVYVRPFDGAFFYFLHSIGKHQLGLKYDWYDPNTRAAGKEITMESGNFTGADIRYNTLGAGYIYYLSDNMKLVLWYEWVKNESTGLTGFEKDLRDNVLTCRLQFKF